MSCVCRLSYVWVCCAARGNSAVVLESNVCLMTIEDNLDIWISKPTWLIHILCKSKFESIFCICCSNSDCVLDILSYRWHFCWISVCVLRIHFTNIYWESGIKAKWQIYKSYLIYVQSFIWLQYTSNKTGNFGTRKCKTHSILVNVRDL